MNDKSSINLLQVPWWLRTTCAHPKSACRRTATVATVATTRTSVTSSQSFSPRTPASVSLSSVCPAAYWTLLCKLFLLYLSLSSSSKFFLFSSTLLCWSLPCFAFYPLSFPVFFSPSLPNKCILLPGLHCRETSHCTTLPESVCVFPCSFVHVCAPYSCSRTATPDLTESSFLIWSAYTSRINN